MNVGVDIKWKHLFILLHISSQYNVINNMWWENVELHCKLAEHKITRRPLKKCTESKQADYMLWTLLGKVPQSQTQCIYMPFKNNQISLIAQYEGIFDGTTMPIFIL